MSDSIPDSSFPPPKRRSSSCTFYSFLFFSLLLPIIASIVVYQLDSFDPAPYPLQDHTQPPLKALTKNNRILHGSDRLGAGLLQAPEDLAYDDKLGVIYTGCGDGWIKRVRLNESVTDSVVDDLVNTGGRPLGVAIGHYNELIVADSFKGLLNITSDGSVRVLSQEAEGVKFKLTDGVGVANDGMIYFTDASYKYDFNDFIWDFLGGKPYGRLMSYDPATKETKVLLKDLYFANGVAVSPDQTFVVYCETPLRRCSKYYIQGEKKKGSIDDFISNLPGYPDNIHFDAQGRAWIAVSMETTLFWDLTIRYPVIRKVMGIMEKYVGVPIIGKNGGVLVVDSEGKLCERYYDPELKLISTGIKIGDHLYCGSVGYPYIIRLDLSKYPALPAHEQ